MNDEKDVEVASHQVMKCILCYDNVVNILNPRIKERNGLIIYYKTYGITAFNKHVDADHSIIVKKLEEINNEIIGNVERQLAKKRPNVLTSVICVAFVVKESLRKNDV